MSRPAPGMERGTRARMPRSASGTRGWCGAEVIPRDFLKGAILPGAP